MLSPLQIDKAYDDPICYYNVESRCIINLIQSGLGLTSRQTNNKTVDILTKEPVFSSETWPQEYKSRRGRITYYLISFKVFLNIPCPIGLLQNVLTLCTGNRNKDVCNKCHSHTTIRFQSKPGDHVIPVHYTNTECVLYDVVMLSITGAEFLYYAVVCNKLNYTTFLKR